MREHIEGLLVLQDRDRKRDQIEEELERVPQDEAAINRRFKQQSEQFEAAKVEARHIEAERKKLELEVESHRSSIAKYRTQQNQTRKNEEFSALNNEIDHAEKKISGLEDRELELMENYESAQKKVAEGQVALKELEVKKGQQLTELARKKTSLETELARVKNLQATAESAVEPAMLAKYRRILSTKDPAIVPIDHASCGGCHMKLTSQTVVSARGSEALVQCENCGRIVYCPE